MEEMKVKLAIFEGPLDLLLHLLNELELDIYDIPISQITDQYLTYIHAMKHLELEIAGEYLVMAATLMAMKSRMLLPTEEYEEEWIDYEEEDPREQLIAQLVEYKKYKQAAQTLSSFAQERETFFHSEPMELEDYQESQVELKQNQVNTIDLFLAFHQLLEKKKKRKKIDASIAKDETTVDEKIMWITKKIQEEMMAGCTLEALLVTGTKEELVTTFMAMLELMKYQKIKVAQTAQYAEIKIYPGEQLYEGISGD
ncbi:MULTISPECIES: segregation/condensation protein A [Enterococcus]|uniref:Segregation and condensation protein A n=1 Tax=Enterococcus sulfureus ATCC 49903 TaxID=1140003 RepID=S0NRP5_9ENTE|nr:segregation/condensation protein A [Enterococcus sulfureus]EOT47987.1 hypothetical protein OMY_00794 [Enterococcus sulfureus ATCC 49903]EOT84157.1 hypothetical protein I573_01884 [Enterococcus sulfureus ATCC 49903]